VQTILISTLIAACCQPSTGYTSSKCRQQSHAHNRCEMRPQGVGAG
jgi:hypothetical protein